MLYNARQGFALRIITVVSVAQVVTRSVSNPKHILKNKHLSMASIKKLILLKGDTFVENTTYVEFT